MKRGNKRKEAYIRTTETHPSFVLFQSRFPSVCLNSNILAGHYFYYLEKVIQ